MSRGNDAEFGAGGTLEVRAGEPVAVYTKPRPAINLRSVALGLFGVIFVCGLTPYSDHALKNTPLVGNNLPLGLTVAAFLFAVLVNAPLWRFAPRYAFSTAEVAVAFSMTLISCSLPGQGLMTYFLPSIVAPFYYGQDYEYRTLMTQMQLPDWLFPTFSSSKFADRVRDPVVTGYYRKLLPGDGPIPFAAWVRPAVAWGIFLFALYGALVSLMILVRRQWLENERLGFPLAQVQLALIEQPERGHFLNTLFRSRVFWTAVVLVLVIRTLNGANEYWPRYVPRISMEYNVRGIFTEGPFQHVSMFAVRSTVYLIIVGITFFIPTSVAFSLWVFIILNEISRMIMGTATGTPARGGERFEHMGAILAFGLTAIWIGRRHWRMILYQAFRGRREGEPDDPYLSYRTAFWIFVACLAVMVGWLYMAGCSLIGAAVMVLILIFLFFIIARIIADTGLVYGQLLFPIYAPWQLAAMYGWQHPVSLETFFHGSMMQVKFFDFREPVTVYTSHALKVSGEAGVTSDEQGRRSSGRWLIVLLMVSLLVGYVVSFGSMLATEYTYGATLDASETEPLNKWGAVEATRIYEMAPASQYRRGNYNVVGSPAAQMSGGFIFTALLGFLRLRYVWWPLHPIGYLISGTTPGQIMWFSIFLGWLCKVTSLRIGGATLYQKAKPFFLGLVVGDSLAAGIWLVITLILAALGVEYQAINLMPN